MRKCMLLGLILGLSCQKSSPQEKSFIFRENKQITKKLVSQDGLFKAGLKAINPEIGPKLNGSVTVYMDTTHFVADVRFSRGTIRSIHHQNIHLGSRCPDSRDDLNQDGFIDYKEGIKVYGKALIPLDDDLSSQRMGDGIFPVSDNFGNYLWSRGTSRSSLLSDLSDEDLNPEDDLAKLSGIDLSILNKAIIILGAPKSLELPDSIKSKDYLDAHTSLPVACGILERVLKTPGVIDNDEGVEVGEIESPDLDDGADFPTTPNPNNYGE